MRENGGLRPRGRAVVLLLALAVAGCGGDGDRAAEADWQGRPELQQGGTVPVTDFAAFQAEVEARWERSPALVAGAFLRLDERDASRTTVGADAGPESSGPATVTVTLEGLQDDSVAAQRYVLRLRREGETWRLQSASWAQRCQRGRGHQAFTAEPCL